MKVYLVEGNIGVGKTTFIKNISEHFTSKGYSVLAVCEPIEEWEEDGVLAKFYSDTRKYAYAFQTYVVSSKFEHIQKSIVARAKEIMSNRISEKAIFDNLDDIFDYVFIERSVFSDSIFVDALHDGSMPCIDDTHYFLYKRWSRYFRQEFIKIFPDFSFILIRGDNTADVVNNIEKRGREYEKDVDRAYIDVLDGYHCRKFMSSHDVVTTDIAKIFNNVVVDEYTAQVIVLPTSDVNDGVYKLLQ